MIFEQSGNVFGFGLAPTDTRPQTEIIPRRLYYVGSDCFPNCIGNRVGKNGAKKVATKEE